MASYADFEQPRYAISGGRGDPETAAPCQARWCERATAYRSMLPGGADVSGYAPASTDRGRTNALRRRLLLLRQPRPPTTKAADASGPLIRSANVEQYIQEGFNIIFTRDAEYACRPIETNEQYYRNREAMLRQYQTWNGIDIKKINLPFYPEPVLHKTMKVSRKGRTWLVDDPAARQLSQRVNRTPQLTRFGAHLDPARRTFSTGSANLPRRIVQEERDAFPLPTEHYGYLTEPATRHRTVVASVRNSTPQLSRWVPRQSRKNDGAAAVDARSSPASPRQAVDTRTSPPPPPPPQGLSNGSVIVREKSVRFSDELTVHEHSRDDDNGDGWREAAAADSAATTRSRAMTAVLLSQRQPMTGGRAEYVEKLRKKSRRQFLHALDRVIARLKRAKLGAGSESPRRAPLDRADGGSAPEAAT